MPARKNLQIQLMYKNKFKPCTHAFYSNLSWGKIKRKRQICKRKITVQNNTKNTKDWPIRTLIITGCEIICVKKTGNYIQLSGNSDMTFERQQFQFDIIYTGFKRPTVSQND